MNIDFSPPSIHGLVCKKPHYYDVTEALRRLKPESNLLLVQHLVQASIKEYIKARHYGLRPFVWGYQLLQSIDGFPSQRVSDAVHVSLSWRHNILSVHVCSLYYMWFTALYAIRVMIGRVIKIWYCIASNYHKENIWPTISYELRSSTHKSAKPNYLICFVYNLNVQWKGMKHAKWARPKHAEQISSNLIVMLL